MAAEECYILVGTTHGDSAIFAASSAAGGRAARVDPISTVEYPTPARRPINCLLDNTKFLRTFGVAQREWQEGVRLRVAAMLHDCVGFSISDDNLRRITRGCNG